MDCKDAKQVARNEFHEFLKRRYQEITTDNMIEPDTQIMVPYLQQMLLRGVVSVVGQGGVIRDNWRQRPFLRLAVPCHEENQFDQNMSIIKDMTNAGYVVVHSEWGLIVPQSMKGDIVERYENDFTKHIDDGYFLSESDKLAIQMNANVISYGINCSNSRTSESEWEPDGCAHISLCDSECIEYVLHEFGEAKAEFMKVLRHSFHLVTIIDPEWGGDTSRFIETIARSIAEQYKPVIERSETCLSLSSRICDLSFSNN